MAARPAAPPRLARQPSTSSTDSFHSAVSHAPAAPPHASAAAPPLPPRPPAQRARWFFHKDRPPASPPTPPRPPRRPRPKPPPSAFRPDDLSRPVPTAYQTPPLSPAAPGPPPHRPDPRPAPPHPAPDDPPADPAPRDVDDWGLDELSDDSESRVPPPRPPDPPHPVPASEPGPHRDTLTLRAFDESLQQSQPPDSVNYLIGVYDPAAATDDWGDDFVLEANIDQPGSEARPTEQPPTPASLPSWIPDQPHPAPQSYLPPPWQPAHASYPPATHFLTSDDHGLPMRPVPPSAFATPTLTHASLLMFPAIGYDAGAAHPSCARVKDLFSRHNLTIRTHFDALVRDGGDVVSLDDRTRAAYLLSGDPDVGALPTTNKDLSVDVLLWKLEWATLVADHEQRAIVLLGLSNVYKQLGNVREALFLVRDALAALPDPNRSNLSIALATELEYENCILHRGVGAIAEAGRALKRAMAHSAHLAAQPEHAQDLPGPEQRGLWWQLRCKFLQAEMAHDLEDHDSAVQYYSEYIVESVTRMIGVTAPPNPQHTTLGAQFMRYCLFSPRRLVLALWTTLVSLGEMKSFAAAADIASLTSLVAAAFGYEDANKAASAIRSRIKDIGVELRQQYDDISKNILQSDEHEVDEIRTTAQANQMPASPFDYSVGDFGDVGDDVVEDWDAQLERELNITIERCDGEQRNVDNGPFVPQDTNPDPSTVANEAFAVPLPDHGGSNSRSGTSRLKASGRERPHTQQPASAKWATGPQQGNLIEAELRQYLRRVAGKASAISAQQVYPKPTQPFDGHLMGPREHENFLRRFVRSKDPVYSKRLEHGLPVTPQWHPSAVCKLNFNIEPIEDIDSFNASITGLSKEWGQKLVEAVWKVVRSQVPLQTKQSRARRLILNAFSKVSMALRKHPTHDEADRRDRLETLAALLDVLRLAREVVTGSGNEAVWFSRACIFLGVSAATVTPTAKAAVELLQAESRAHCGVKATVPAVTLDRCRQERERLKDDREPFGESSSTVNQPESEQIKDLLPPALRQSVVDVMHALYWRTKAGFDESSDKSSLERLLHADVASSLFLTGSGISPVDGSSIDLSAELSLLPIREKPASRSAAPKALVDETRRVSASELIQELQSLWSSLPSSAGTVRAKVSFALAHHSRVTQRDYARAERFLFDGLRSLYSVSEKQGPPTSFFTSVIHVSPVAIVSSPLAAAILHAYGSLALSHSKYRYGIAALESATDGRRVRNMDKQAYRSSVMKVVDAALSNNDWRLALVLLYNLRYLVHPKNGLRNEFLHLCLRLHLICSSVGCFEASIVPLRAYSALIYEERLRVLLQRYKRRLTKKSRSKFRRYISGSPLPKLLPGTSVFPNKRNALASFFEAPLVTAALDTTLRQSTSLIDLRLRQPSTAATAPATPPSGQSALKRLFSLLWPLHLAFLQNRFGKRKASTDIPPTNVAEPTAEEPGDAEDHKTSEDENKSASNAAGNETRPGSNFEEEQRELLRIEAEQEVAADSDRFNVELLRAKTDFDRADYLGAEVRCRGLLEVSTSHAARYKVWEVMARIRLKRREITKCLEFIEQMESEYHLSEAAREPSEPVRSSGDAQRLSIFRLHDSDRESQVDETKIAYAPKVTFLRLTALLHGGRLDEALYLADKALEACSEHSFWDQGRLHYLRGKVLHAMSSSSTASFQREDETKSSSQRDVATFNLKITELTLAAFETASQYYEAAGDEICTAKSDLLWARSCIDFLFRRVVLKPDFGGGWPLRKACLLLDKRIVIDEVVDTVYSVINIASNANVPLLLIDAMAALAEVKCIQGHPSSTWSLWVSEAWRLFSRLFTDAEDFTVVLGKLAPVSTLERLRNVCGRLVRLVMCDERTVSVADMNKHLRLFEAYVTLQLSIDQKMNLASNEHAQGSFSNSIVDGSEDDNLDADEGEGLPFTGGSPYGRPERKRRTVSSGNIVRINLPKSGSEKKSGTATPDPRSDRFSESTSDISGPRRPPGAFLHILGNEGVALGRQGFSLFINRPRQQVISAVKGTGAVLIPSNFFTNSKAAPGDGPHELGRDAEMIFPFKPSLGLGAMKILNDDLEADEEVLSGAQFAFSNVSGVVDLSKHRSAETPEQQRASHTPSAHAPEATRTDESYVVRESQASLFEVDEEPKPTSDNTSTPASERSGKKKFGRSREAEPGRDRQTSSTRNYLTSLLNNVREELESGNVRTKGSSQMFGRSTPHRVWAHLHRIKAATKLYMHGEISMEQLQARNNDALSGWVHCIPLSRKEWTVPESIGRRLVHILYAHGVIGYYAVDRGGSIERVAFGGKQDSSSHDYAEPSTSKASLNQSLRPPTDAERLYLFELVKGFKRDGVWHKNRDSEIVNGMAKSVLRAPRLLLSSSSPVHKSRSRPIVLVADLPLQILPWELFFDHVVIRSHCLLDVIRGLQEDPAQTSGSLFGNEDPAVAAARRIARFITFGASRRELADLERTEEARRQELAFEGLLRLNHMNPASLTGFLDLGGFSDPTAVNAVVRPTGPLSSPLSQTRKAVKLLGLRISANIGKRNFPHIDFLRVAGLGSATTWDLREAAMVLQPNLNDKDEPQKDLGAYIPVFMFTYADLVESNDSVFGLRRIVPNGILMFTPATHMKVLARHLEDEELSVELARASGRIHNRIFPDVTASARVLVEYVSRFSREKRIPIVVFLGQGLVDVFPRKRIIKGSGNPQSATAAERLAQLSGAGRVEYFRN